jgi:hypothetical protein
VMWPDRGGFCTALASDVPLCLLFAAARRYDHGCSRARNCRVSAASRNKAIPRNASPSAVCMDENATQLMHAAGRSLLPRAAG